MGSGEVICVMLTTRLSNQSACHGMTAVGTMIVNAIVIICAVASAQNVNEKDSWIEEVNELDRAREPASVALTKSEQRLKLENPSRRANDWRTKHTHDQAEIKPRRLRVVITTHELQIASSHGKLQDAGLQACRAAYQPHVPRGRRPHVLHCN